MSVPVTTTGMSYKGYVMMSRIECACRSAQAIFEGLGLSLNTISYVELKEDIVYVSFLYTDGTVGDVSGTLSFDYVDENVYVDDNES